MLSTSGFVDDVMFAHNRIGKGDAKKSCIYSVTHQGQKAYLGQSSVTALFEYAVVKQFSFPF